MTSIVVAILVFVALGALFGVGFYLNQKTPKPKGCENLTADCEGCRITTCPHHPHSTEGEKENA